MDKKKIFRNLISLLLVLAVSAAVEVLVINGATILKLIRADSLTNQIYSLADFAPANWTAIEHGFRSMQDPILVLPDLKGKIDSVYLEFETNKDIPYVDLFYTNETYETFGGETYLHWNTISDGKAEIPMGFYVGDLRVDIGDDAGVELYSLTMLINPVKLKISPFRIGTMVVLYYMAAFLFSLQKPAEYHMSGETDLET